MTNEEIVFSKRVELMEKELLKSTGAKMMVYDAEGKEKTIEVPEELHTYQAWKKMGYQVQKGQKAIAKFKIWKHTTKKAKSEKDVDEEKMFIDRKSVV